MDMFFLYFLSLGLFAGVFATTRCGIQRYRMENDWVSFFIMVFVTIVYMLLVNQPKQQV